MSATAVTLIRKEEAEAIDRRPQPDLIDITEENSSFSQAQICRTCEFQSNRTWATDNKAITKHIRAGGKVEDLMCHPRKVWGALKVLNTTDWRKRIVPVKSTSKLPTRAIVDTCGQKLLSKCATCDRFAAVTTRVAYTNTGAKVGWTTEVNGGKVKTVPVSSDGSPIRWWNVTVGGHCTIPAEGIMVGGQVTFCDHQPRLKRVEPNCSNCYYLDFKGDHWQSDRLEVNANATLTPWEREVALNNARYEAEAKGEPFGPSAQGMAIGLALWRKQVEPYGRRAYHKARLLDERTTKQGRLIYTVQFIRSNVKARIADDDEIYDVVRLANPKLVSVGILWPHNRQFRLPMPLYTTAYFWPEMPAPTRIEPDLSDRVVDGCGDCRKPVTFTRLDHESHSETVVTRPGKPCYFHAKGPQLDTVSREVLFLSPNVPAARYEYPPHAKMHVTKRNGIVVAVDGNGNLPDTYSDTVANATVLRHHMRWLMDTARRLYGAQGAASIMAQYVNIISGLRVRDKGGKIRPSWLRPSTMEANKSYCSHPDGLDLRKLFQDSFGTERVDWDFDHGLQTSMAVEEEVRVGWRQHNMTPQRLQEEIMTTDSQHPDYDPSIGFVEDLGRTAPADVTITGEAAIGGMYIDGRPVTDTREFIDRLDEVIEVGWLDEDKKHPRTMTRRQQLYGYELSRGFYGKRSSKRKGSDKTSIPAADPTMVRFGLTDEDAVTEIADMWFCVVCQATYDHGEVEFFDPTCDCGEPLVKNHMARETFNTRGEGGVGNALVKASEAMLNRQRLQNTVCEHWRLNAGMTVITIDDVEGPALRETPVEVKAGTRSAGAKVIKVGVLTDEHKAHNAEYQAKMDAVIVARRDYLSEYPDEPVEDLLLKFPTPEGTVYQVKAAGSLSKMGGV